MNISKIRNDFPILRRKINGKPLIYFDNGATTQKPRQVIEAVSGFYQTSNANIHRGIHTLAEEATGLYEETRKKVARFIKAKSEKEIVFVRNTTEALNLVAYAWGRLSVEAGDEIVTTVMEHHSNFLPWRQLALENGAMLKVVDIDENYELRIKKQELREVLSGKTRAVAMTHASNVLGTINPIREISFQVREGYPLASGRSPLVVVDGAQFIPHGKVDVQDLGCDFYAFSGHKMFGPMGAGVLWGRQEILERMAPFLFGGGMITTVTLAEVGIAPVPERFEAGTPSVAEVVGLGAAVDYLEHVGFGEIASYESELTKKLLADLGLIGKVKIYGPGDEHDRVPAVAFTVDGVHPHDVAQFFNDEYGIAVRAGQHCAGPLHERLNVPATVRASLAFYNTEEEVETLIKATRDLIKTFT